MSVVARITRVVWILVGSSLLITLLATAWFVVATIRVRIPYWGEAETLFEASRMRDRLALYVDPIVGAADYLGPPSRYYVTYPPLWSWIVSWVPKGGAVLFARLAC